MTKDMKESRVYKNALLKSMGLQYFAFILLFFLEPLVFLFAYFKILKDSDFIINAVTTALTAIIIFMVLGLSGIFICVRKHWVNRIVIDNEKITFYGLFKQVQSYWHDVLRIESHKAPLGNIMGKVITKNGVFLFPYTIKEEDEKYPTLRLTLDDWHWVDENGAERKAELLNCPLFIYIQNKLPTTSS